MAKTTDWGTYKAGGQQNTKATRKKDFKAYGGSVAYSKNFEEETVQSVLDETKICAVPQMSLSLDAAKYFGIRSKLSMSDGKTVEATYLPYYDKYGKLTGFKKRDWHLEKGTKGHFTVVGAVKVASQFFGQKQVSMSTGNSSKIYVVEGEGDVAAAWQSLYDKFKEMAQVSKKPGVVQWAKSILEGVKKIQDGETELNGSPTIPVIGLNCGTGNAVETFANNEKFIRKFEKVVLAFDNDEATAHEKAIRVKKGREATDDVAGFLLSENIYIAKYPNERNDPDGFKDVRDMYDAGLKTEVYNMLTKASDRYVPDKLISLADVSVECLRKKKKDGVPLPQLPGLYKLTRGPRRGELWTITGPSGAGKSTVAGKIEYAIADYLRNMKIPRLDGWTEEERMCTIRLEEDEEETINRFYAEELMIDPKAFVADPEQFLTEEEHAAIHKKWIEEDKVEIFDHFGSIPTDQLLQKLKQMVFLKGCKWIILDHLSMVISGLKSDNERKDLDIIMTELAAFCKQYDVFILCVSHMKRKDLQVPKDKDNNPLPFWYPVRKEDLRGSAAIEQLSWIIIGVEPEELPDRSRCRVRLVLLKNRTHKILGIADVLIMDENGQFSDATGWEWVQGLYMKDGQVVYRPNALMPPQVIKVETPVGEVAVEAIEPPEFVPDIEGDSSTDEEPPF